MAGMQIGAAMTCSTWLAAAPLHGASGGSGAALLALAGLSGWCGEARKQQATEDSQLRRDVLCRSLNCRRAHS